MRVGDIMNRYVEFIEADALVKDAAIMMGDLDVGGLPVGAADNLLGVITDRDILYRVVASGLDSSTTKVADILSRPAVTCGEDDDLQTVMELMAAHHLRRLAVCDSAGRVVGWITLADLSRKLLIDSGLVQRALTDITRREPPQERSEPGADQKR